MDGNSVTFPELLRTAANCAETCLGDKNCTVNFGGRGVESTGDDRFVVNLAGAVLVKLFSHPTNKSLETHAGPPWQASLHETSSGNIGRALEYAFGTSVDAAPSDVLLELTSLYRRIGSGARSTARKIEWVRKTASTLEQQGDWPCSSQSLDFRDPDQGPKARMRLSVTSRPFSKVCEEIEALIGGKNLQETISGRGDMDFSGIRAELERIKQAASELSEVTSDDLSRDDAERTSMALDSILSMLTSIKEWDLSRERAASERVSYMNEVVALEKDLGRAMQGWFPMWWSRRLERKRAVAQETEQRARQAQAEASGEATNEIADAYEAQGTRAKNSRYLWTALSFAAAAGILVVAFTLMNGEGSEQVGVWSVQRLDSIITRFLSASVFGGVAFWAGRIATMRLREESEHLHKALVARTLKGMKEGADTDEARAQIDLIAHSSLLHRGDHGQQNPAGPVTGNPGSQLKHVISNVADAEKG